MIYFIYFLTYILYAAIIIDECNKKEVNCNGTSRQNMEQTYTQK